jgi:transglutaminase-like putative cysteine protease
MGRHMGWRAKVAHGVAHEMAHEWAGGCRDQAVAAATICGRSGVPAETVRTS